VVQLVSRGEQKSPSAIPAPAPLVGPLTTLWFPDPQFQRTVWPTRIETVGAENVAQAYEFVKFAFSARNAALFSNETGYDTVVAGVDRFLNKVVKAKMAESYPDNALANIWWWPPEPVWYSALRDAFTDQFVAA